MEKKIVSYRFKKRTVRFLKYLKIIGLSPKPIELTMVQKKAVSIIRIIVNKQDAELSINPEVGTCIAEYNQYMVKLLPSSIVIKNTVFDSYIEIDSRVGEKLIKLFYKKLGERITKKEEFYNLKTVNKLTKIYEEIK